jgi:predicted patatin/cPLA2 family phospholipase
MKQTWSQIIKSIIHHHTHIIKIVKEHGQQSSKTWSTIVKHMVAHHQKTWSTIIKTIVNNQKKQSMVQIVKTHGKNRCTNTLED